MAISRYPIRLWLALMGAVLLFMPVAHVQAQQTPSFWLETLREAYQRLDYERAEEAGRTILQDYQAYSSEALTEVYTTLGIIHFTQDNQPVARRHFENALALTPALQLDPNLTSPKILAFFEEVQANQMATLPGPGETPTAEVRYVLVQDPRPAAAMRSMVLPGWGQRYKAEQKRGWIFTGAFAGLGAGALTTHLLRQDAQRQYRAEADPARIEDRYQSFNQWHKTRNNLALAAGAVWVASYLDALLRPTVFESPVEQAAVQVHATPLPTPQVAVRFTF